MVLLGDTGTPIILAIYISGWQNQKIQCEILSLSLIVQVLRAMDPMRIMSSRHLFLNV